jgi:hypothetical protein
MIYRADTFVLPVKNRLRQRGARDCGVCVFAELAGISYEQLLEELPGADYGTVTVDGWIAWLESKGRRVTKHEGCPADAGCCAHLVSNTFYSKEDVHWVYRDENGDVHDPSPVAEWVPANSELARTLETYSIKVLTLAVSK